MRPNLFIRNSLPRLFLKDQLLQRFGSYISVLSRQQHSVSSVVQETSTLPQDDFSRKEPPRWSFTPERLKMPVRVRMINPNKRWECNTSPRILDQFYIKFLGPGGDKLLSDEVKWLAITHKSFEQGARGFNDRLAYLGRRILNLQTNLMLLSTPVSDQSESSVDPVSDNRIPFKHPALEGLENLYHSPLLEVLPIQKLALFATSIGMREIVRWHPRSPRDLVSSGVEVVLVTSLYAIIGALALERGGHVASDIARNNILKQISIRRSS